MRRGEESREIREGERELGKRREGKGRGGKMVNESEDRREKNEKSWTGIRAER